MKHYKNLTLIGTSHIAKQSINEVKTAISKQKPEIIALELDRSRFHAILQKNKSSPKLRGLSLTEAIIVLIGYYSEKILGKAVGTSPGDEMKTAILLAKQNNSKIMLIDQNIRITLKRLKNQLTFKEKLRFFLDLLTAPFQKKQKIDLNKVPPQQIITKILKETKKKYPNLHKVLIEERNIIMAKNLNRIMQKYPEEKIIAIVGAGHEEDIISILKQK